VRVVLASDSFKGSLTAAAVCDALAEGLGAQLQEVILILKPMADGGEGTLSAVARALPQVSFQSVEVLGADLKPLTAGWLLLPEELGEPKTAIVELASACGIEHLSTLRPMTASTFGLGQVIRAAIDSGVTRLLVGLGSSASTDGGAGMLSALGAKLFDAKGEPIAPGGAALSELVTIDLSGLSDLAGIEIIGLTDVNSPLLGEKGAAKVFGPQKGADPEQVEQLDAALRHFSDMAGAALAEVPGAGAAGGTGFGLLLLGAQLKPGAETIAELIGLEAACADADLVITGEGRFDSQSAAGKVPAKVAALAVGKTALVAGQILPDADLSGFVSTTSLTELAGSSELAIGDAARWLRQAGAALAAGYETAR
jgi:glycerate 2-kinase